MNLPARLLWRLVFVYQILASARPSICRFVPSCSNYALEAFERHGGARGSWLVMRRLLRCHPWGRTGWDPVPESTSCCSRSEVLDRV